MFREFPASGFEVRQPNGDLFCKDTTDFWFKGAPGIATSYLQMRHPSIGANGIPLDLLKMNDHKNEVFLNVRPSSHRELQERPDEKTAGYARDTLVRHFKDKGFDVSTGNGAGNDFSLTLKRPAKDQSQPLKAGDIMVELTAAGFVHPELAEALLKKHSPDHVKKLGDALRPADPLAGVSNEALLDTLASRHGISPDAMKNVFAQALTMAKAAHAVGAATGTAAKLAQTGTVPSTQTAGSQVRRV